MKIGNVTRSIVALAVAVGGAGPFLRAIWTMVFCADTVDAGLTVIENGQRVGFVVICAGTVITAAILLLRLANPDDEEGRSPSFRVGLVIVLVGAALVAIAMVVAAMDDEPTVTSSQVRRRASPDGGAAGRERDCPGLCKWLCPSVRP